MSSVPPHKHSHDQGRYLAFLDGLRAIAILSVLLYHLDKNFVPNGYLGVDIFFVISGFIVSYSVYNRKIKNVRHLLLDFYARRFTRIIPALIVCLLITSIFSFLFIPDAWLSNKQYKTAQMAFFGLSNIQLSQGTDYFSTITDFNPFAHTWSLGVEEQFYIIFPLLFFPWLMMSAARRYALWAAIIGALLSLGLWLHLGRVEPLQAFYMIYARFWQLAAGVICFQITVRRGGKGRAFPGAAAALLGLGVLAAALWANFSPAQAWIGNILAVGSTVLIIASLQQARVDGLAPALLEARPVRFIGKISYSLYLWHWPVFVLARWTVGLVTPLQLAAASALALMLAVISYYFVELPVRHSSRLRAAPRQVVIALGIACVAASFGIFDYLRSNRYQLSLSVVMQNRELWMADSSRNAFEDLPNCFIQEVPAGATVSYRRSGCENRPGNAPRVYFLGDSHAFSYVQLIKRFTLSTGIETVFVSTGGCPFLSLQWHRDSQPGCMAAIENATSILLAQARAGDLIFLPALRVPRLSEQFAQFTDESAVELVFGPTAAADRAKAVNHAVEVLKPLASKGLNILFEAPKPIFRASPFRCSDWFNQGNPSCTSGLTIEKDFVERLRQPTLDAFARISEAVPGVSVWDPLPVLCPAAKCEAVPVDRPLFMDGDHVSGLANVVLTPSFNRAVMDILADRRASNSGQRVAAAR